MLSLLIGSMTRSPSVGVDLIALSGSLLSSTRKKPMAFLELLVPFSGMFVVRSRHWNQVSGNGMDPDIR